MIYSIFNNYNYQNKSFIFSSLDLLSTPCRRVLGGRNICVLSETHENEMSVTGKVMTVFISVLVFPVAIVSIASLLIKAVTFPWLWESTQVETQSQQSWNILNQFNTAIQNGDYDQAIQKVYERPEIVERKEVYNSLFKAINKKINQGTSWGQIEKWIPFLNANEAIELTAYTIKLQLSGEFNNDRHVTSGKEICDFVQNSLKYKSVANIETCYKKILSDVLLINTTEDPFLTVVKMDLANCLIKSLTQIQKNNAKDQLAITFADLNENSLRQTQFLSSGLSLYLTSKSQSSMAKINTVLQSIRSIQQMGLQTLDQLDALSKQRNLGLLQQLNQIGQELSRFRENLNELNPTADEWEKQYIQRSKDWIGSMIRFIDTRHSTIEEIEPHCRAIERTFVEHTDRLKSSLDSLESPRFLSASESHFAFLFLKKKQCLIVRTEAIRTFLTNSMFQNIYAARA